MAKNKGVFMKICNIDGKLITDKNKLHETLSTSLDFPTWYGANLDALYDCLTDICEETQITILNNSELELNLGKYAQLLYKVLDSASKDNNFVSWNFT
jgi:ribonuclease inhibitor